MKKHRLNWSNTYFWNCPCRCCDSAYQCNSTSHKACQDHLDLYTCLDSGPKFKTYKLYQQLQDDLKLYQEALLQETEDGFTDKDKEFVFISSRLAYIKELLERYF